MSKYGENIKKIRSVRGLTQSQLADIIDVSRGVISSYEEGRAEPKIETIIKTAEVFQVTVDSLLKKNITVNQLSGFTMPDILNDKKPTEATQSLGSLADFFPHGLIIIKAADLKENTYCQENDLVFGLEQSLIKNKSFIIDMDSESIIGKITHLTHEIIVIDEREVLMKDIKRTIKVIGIYQPIQSTSPLDERLLLMETRLQQLEDKLKSK